MSETKLEQAQEALRQCKEQLQLFNAAVEDAAVFTLSPQGYVLTWNPGAERIKGYKSDEIMSKHFSCFFPSEAIALGRPQRGLVAAFEQGNAEDESWRVRNDEQSFWAHVVTTALLDKQGALRGFAKVVRDLSGRLASKPCVPATRGSFGISPTSLYQNLIESTLPGASKETPTAYG